MQVRAAKSNQAKIEQQMTPMIDVVFQLLTFFILSFKVVTAEGDFNLKMPLARGDAGNPSTFSPLPLKLYLQADEQGELNGLRLNDTKFAPGDWRGVQSRLLHVVGSETAPGSLRETLEVQIECDYQLHYDHTIAAVTAISGTRSASGQFVPLIKRIKFGPPTRSALTPGRSP